MVSWGLRWGIHCAFYMCDRDSCGESTVWKRQFRGQYGQVIVLSGAGGPSGATRPVGSAVDVSEQFGMGECYVLCVVCAEPGLEL